MKSFLCLAIAWLSGAAAQDGVAPPLVIASSLEADYARPLVDRFSEAHPGLEVLLVELESRFVLERIRGASKAGRTPISVWWGGDDLALHEASAEGLLEPGAPSWASRAKASETDRDGRWAGIFVVPMAVAFRADCQDLPSSYEDLADPRFRSRLLLRTPSSSDPMRRFLGVLFASRFQPRGSLDRAFDWAAMVYVNQADSEPFDDERILTRLASRASPPNEIGLLPASVVARARDLDGLAIDFTVLPGAPAYVEGIARVRGGPNPAAALEFLEFAGSAEAVREGLRRGRIPVGDVKGEPLVKGLSAGMAVDLGDLDLLAQALPAWTSQVERRIQVGVAAVPEGEDPNLWIFNLIDVVGTVAIVAVLVMLLRRGKYRALAARDAAPGVPDVEHPGGGPPT